MSNAVTPERWLPVVGWAGVYQVSDHGRVWSVPRKALIGNGRYRSVRGRYLRQKLLSGYSAVTLSAPRKDSTRLVHQLVLEAFVGACPAGYEACHFDGNRQNAALTNLRWDTFSENNLDQVRSGTHAGVNKTRCKYGHLLVEPNLVARKPRFQQRACLACSRGRSQVTYYAKTGRAYFSIQEASDRYYAVIMTGEAAV